MIDATRYVRAPALPKSMNHVSQSLDRSLIRGTVAEIGILTQVLVFGQKWSKLAIFDHFRAFFVLARQF